MSGQRAFGGTLIASRQARPNHLTQTKSTADESASRPVAGVAWQRFGRCSVFPPVISG